MLPTRLASLLKNLLRGDRVEAELDEELRSYLDMLAEEKRAAGMSPDEARRAALVELGGLEQVKERVREVRAGVALEQLGSDVALGLRGLRRDRGFTLVAAATLALGIGANTAVFSVVDTVALRPPPYREPDRLFKICGVDLRASSTCADMSLPDVADLSHQSDVFEQVAADDGVGFTLSTAGRSEEPVFGALVTPNWLSALGVRPALGRDFVPEEAAPGRDRVVILTHRYWKRRFRGDPEIVGKTLILDREPFAVVGVLPPNVLRYESDFLKPLVPAQYRSERGFRDLDVFARLAPGVSPARAGAEVEAIASRLAAEHPATNRGRGIRLRPLGRQYAGLSATGGSVERGLMLMLGAVALVLLIACADVAGLLLARGAARYREYAIRAALGAGQGRLLRQLLVENLLLFSLGGALGVLLARLCLDLLVGLAVAAGHVPERITVMLDGRVLGFGLALSLLTGALFGAVPALRASRLDLSQILGRSGPGASGRWRRSGARRLLVVAELALTVVLLVGFGLLTRSFWRVQAAAPGFEPDGLLATTDHTTPQAPAFWRSLLGDVARLPGVAAAAVTSRPPMFQAREAGFVVEGAPLAPPGQEARARDVFVGPDYFEAMGIPLLAGRALTDRDQETASPVVVVSRSLARRHLGGGSPLGRRLRVNDSPEVWREVVGVVGDVRQASPDDELALTLYRPHPPGQEHNAFLVVRARSRAHAGRLATTLGAYLRERAPEAEWPEIRPMREIIDGAESLRLRRFVLLLLGAFAGLAGGLAALGIYGLMAWTVQQRSREIGIRVALGASRRAVLGTVLGETMALTAAGLGLGLVVWIGSRGLVASMLFGIGSGDAATHLGVSLVLGAVALAAGYGPARRATRVDPISALREE